MKRKAFLVLTVLFVLLMPVTSYAWWDMNVEGYKWILPDGSYAKNGWYWLDVQDNRLECCYYFDENGDNLRNTTTPDGYYVNIDGEWMDGDTVMTRLNTVSSEEEYTNWLCTKRTFPKLVIDGDRIQCKLSEDSGGIKYAKNQWVWIDMNGDWKEELYYFDESGCLLRNATRHCPVYYTDQPEPGERQLNEQGMACLDGVVLSRETRTPVYNGLMYKRPKGGELTDPNSFAKVTMNAELLQYVNYANQVKMSDFKAKYPSTKVGDDGYMAFYKSSYRGKDVTYKAFESSDSIAEFIGTADQILNGIPECGVEADALVKNSGYEKGSIFASTGSMDRDFNLPGGRYRVLHLEDSEHNEPVFIVVTIGSDGKWYIYPDSQASIG